ncbi:DUF4190 domain-containing protein [Microbacterium sp. GXF0217]
MSDSSIPTPPPLPGTPPQAQYPGAVPAGRPTVPSAPASPPQYGAQVPVAPAGHTPPALTGYGQPAPGTAVYPAAGYPASGYAPGYGAPVYAARPNNGAAVAAMVCGIVGVVFGWATFFIVFPVLVSVAAVILGHISLSQLKKTPAVGGRGMAITGLVLGYIPIALTVILVVVAIIAAVVFGAFSLPFIWNS